MDDENVLKLILDGESEQVESKEQLKNKKPEVCQAICAFANDFPRTGRPGVVVIGQRDDGTPRGLPITDALLLELADLLRNALLHRTYEASNAPVRVTWFGDRVEIHSPGGPFGQVTIETIGQPGLTDYRNPTLAGVLNRLGFVQRFGVGIQIARDRLAQNGNSPLEFQASVGAVAAIVRLNR